jgi:hypothetical protein
MKPTQPKLPLAALVALALPAAAFAAAQVQVNFDSGTQTVLNQSGFALTPGSASDGNGAVLELGYYDGASVGNNFAGVWHALTGASSLNTGGDTGSGLAFNTTSIGDIGGGAAPEGSGIFAFSLVFDDTVSGTFNDLPSATTFPLAIRFYDSTAIAGSSFFNVVSNDAWLWKLPATPSPLPPTINMSLDDAGLEWQSIAGAGQSATTAFHTSLPVPEPSAFLLCCLCVPLFAARRQIAPLRKPATDRSSSVV